SRRFSDNFGQLFSKNRHGKGVLVQTGDNFIYIEVFVVLMCGVNVEAVKKSLSDAVGFSVESFTGMRVKRVHINVVGIRVQ
ncbi:MAG: Asp23/Gls24 family envelope stress response protein, partial [Clostridia bacterium]|nr:Asp23/Gls24 family envelope stress response protein [Clostridia bacterium]